MVDLLLVTLGILLAVLLSATTYAAVEYYKQLKRAQKEYEKARDFVESIVLSFNRELRKEAENIQIVAYKLEGTASKVETGVKKGDNMENRIGPLESQISQLSVEIRDMNSRSEGNNQTLEKLSGVDAKIHNLETSQEAIRSQVSGLEEQMQKRVAAPEDKNEMILTAMPVMPIRRDKAISALTDTEVTVLEFLVAEGPKTAPEIREKVQLSREHTARLMKKLYEEGYLERETGKLPFRYSVKKEMEKLLKKTDPPTA